MKYLLVASLLTSVSFAEACSLSLISESILSTSLGTACVNISASQSDANGTFRRMDVQATSMTGEVTTRPTVIVRPKTSKVLLSKVLPGVGNLNIIVLHTTTDNTGTVSFLNGNSLPFTVDANGRVTPSHMCIRQEALNQYRGFANNCP